MRAIVVLVAMGALLATGLGAQLGRDSQAQTVVVRTPLQATDAPAMVGQVGGSVTAVAAKDGLVVTGVGMRLLVFDVSQPSQPTVIGRSQILTNLIKEIVLVENLAYAVVEGEGLAIFDLSDPTAPILMSFWPTDGHAWDIAIEGDYAFLTVRVNGLDVIDVSDPSQPHRVANLDLPADAKRLDVENGYAYVTQSSADGRLAIVDVSDPEMPELIGTQIKSSYGLKDVVVKDRYAYLLQYHRTFLVLDVSDPMEMHEVGRLDDWSISGAHTIVWNGDDIYLVDGYGGFLVLNVDNVTQPSIVSSYDPDPDTYPDSRGLAVFQNGVFLADARNGLHIVDVSNREHPTRLSRYKTGPVATTAATDGNLLIYSDRGGLGVADTSDPATANRIGYLTGAFSWIETEDHYAYTLDRPGGVLSVVDVADSANPHTLSTYSVEDYPYDFAVANAHAYISHRDEIEIIDVRNPENPQTVHRLKDLDYAQIEAANEKLYVVSNLRTPDAEFVQISIFDVSTPSAPILSGILTETFGLTNVRLTDVKLNGDYLFVSGYENIHSSSVRVYNISNPGEPRLLTVYEFSGRLNEMALRGNYAYLAFGDQLRVLKISNLSRPTTVAVLQLNNWINNIALDEHFVYLATGESGALVVEHIPEIVNPGYLWQEEAEDGQLLPRMVRETDTNASACTFIHTSGPGEANYQFDTPYAHQYYAWVRAIGLDWNNNSFWVNIDDGEPYHLELLPVSDHATWSWQRLPDQRLDAGKHTLHVGARERNARLDSVLVSDTWNYDPNDYPGLVTPCDLAPTPFPTSTATPTRTPRPTQIPTSTPFPNYGLERLGTLNAINADYANAYQNYAYVQENQHSRQVLHIVDVSDPSFPSIQGEFEIRTEGRMVLAETPEPRAYIAHGKPHGLSILDISNPLAPIEVGNYQESEYVLDVAVDGNMAYLATGYDGIVMLDVANPAAPAQLGVYDPSDEWWRFERVTVAGQLLFAHENRGRYGMLHIIDVNDPTAPELRGYYSLPRPSANNIVVQGDTVYVTNGQFLLILDVSLPWQPVEVGRIQMDGAINDVAVDQSVIYLAVNPWEIQNHYGVGGGIYMLDIVDPKQPRRVGYYHIKDWWMDIDRAGDMLYVAAGDSGFLILYNDTYPPRMHWQTEAESGTITAPLEIRENVNVSSCRYVTSALAYAGAADYAFDVPVKGYYYVWLRAKGNGWDQNSFWVSIDGGTQQHFEISPEGEAWPWVWKRLTATPLDAGNHHLRISAREANAALDAIVIELDAGYHPQDDPTSITPCQPTPTSTVTPMPTLTPTSTSTATPSPTATTALPLTPTATATMAPPQLYLPLLLS